jgi:hypothetical protein
MRVCVCVCVYRFGIYMPKIIFNLCVTLLCIYIQIKHVHLKPCVCETFLKACIYFINLYHHLPVCLYVCLSVFLTVCLSFGLTICLCSSVCLSVCLSICLMGTLCKPCIFVKHAQQTGAKILSITIRNAATSIMEIDAEW